jgi:hypothetical protein
MNSKLKLLTAAILVGLSSNALATQQVPTDVPPRYLDGPLSPFVDTTNLTAAEKAAYGIYEGLLQVAEGVIDATNCHEFSGLVTVKANGKSSTPINGGPFVGWYILPRPGENYATVTSLGGTLKLEAALWNPVAGRGQKVEVKQPFTFPLGSLDGTDVASYKGTFVYNSVNNMMVGNDAAWEIRGFNGDLDAYKGTVIKDFYRGSTCDRCDEYYTIYDWGLQAVSKLNYPVEKYWQRSKSRRSDGAVGRTVFVKDRLVGESSCRITIDTSGENSAAPIFWQNGYIKVEQVDPGTEVQQFTMPTYLFNGNNGTPQP